MSAMDKLRRMLDERGVEHSDHYSSTTWRDGRGILHLADEQMVDGSLVVDMLTPEQAIAATLGDKHIKELESLVRDIFSRWYVGKLRCTEGCADCGFEKDEGCEFLTRAEELGIEVEQ